MLSFSMSLEGPAIPHLSKGEIADLRGDVDRAFERGELATKKVTIPATEIKALRATPKTLVGAPGADKALELVAVYLRLVAGSEVLAETADNLAVKSTTFVIESSCVSMLVRSVDSW